MTQAQEHFAASRMTPLETADGHRLQAWESGSPEAARAIVVVQEIFGLTQHIRSACVNLAAQGYHVLAPALFDRIGAQTVLPYTDKGVEEGLALRERISDDDVHHDLEACAAYLRRSSAARPVGIIGFCWGGLIAWKSAVRNALFNTAVSWYGGGIAALSDRAPHCPAELHFGENDSTIPHTDIQLIRDNRPEVPIYLYDHAGHGFGCPERPSFNREARDLAWQRSLEFFDSHLKA